MRIRIDAFYDDKTSEIVSVSEGNISIGREVENIIMIDSPAVSRRHGHIFELNGFWIYEDLESANGSYINSQRVNPYDLHVVHDGDELRCANFNVRISFIESCNKSASLIAFKGGEFYRCMSIKDGDSLIAGGKHGHISIEGEDSSLVQFYIYRENDKFVFKRSQLKTEVKINGVVIKDTYVFQNNDNLLVGDYRLIAVEPIVHQIEQAETYKPMPSPVAPMPKPCAIEEEKIVEEPTRPRHPTAEFSMPPTPSPSSVRSKNLVGKQYFHSSNQKPDAESTLSMKDSDFYAQVGAGLSMTQRLSAVNKSSSNKGISDQKLAIIGAIFLIAAAIIVYILFT
ncbi:MAG: FHA domain-containing protein [Deltaproteobacteria bacterium]|nr:FHA domain-containing protein [Deltaproteobacteria bacterium]